MESSTIKYQMKRKSDKQRLMEASISDVINQDELEILQEYQRLSELCTNEEGKKLVLERSISSFSGDRNSAEFLQLKKECKRHRSLFNNYFQKVKNLEQNPLIQAILNRIIERERYESMIRGQQLLKQSIAPPNRRYSVQENTSSKVKDVEPSRTVSNQENTSSEAKDVEASRTVSKKGFHMSIMSLISLVVSVLGLVTYCSLFAGSGLKGLFIVLGIASVVLPPIAKKVRIEQEKSGSAFEIIAIVIGGFNFYCIIFALTSLPVFIAYLGWVACGIAYKMVSQDEVKTTIMNNDPKEDLEHNEKSEHNIEEKGNRNNIDDSASAKNIIHQWRCPECGKLSSRSPCEKCGYIPPNDNIHSTVKSTNVAPKTEKQEISKQENSEKQHQVVENIWICSKCNSKNLIKNDKCWSCGAKFAQKPISIISKNNSIAPIEQPAFVEKEHYTEDELHDLFWKACHSFNSTEAKERRFFEEARGSEALRLAWLDDKRRTDEARARGIKFQLKKTYLDFIKVLDEDYSENLIKNDKCQSCGATSVKVPFSIITKNNSTAPFWCGKCGHEGPYDGNCPKCNSSLKMYNV